MLPDLERRSRDPEAVARLRRTLTLGPWLWPDASDPAYEYATAVTRLERPPQAANRLPVVTIRKGTATLWAIAESGQRSSVELGREAKESWRHAVLVLTRSLPVLWSSFQHHTGLPAIVRLESVVVGKGGRTGTELMVDGPSLGLAFFLLLAARASGVPVEQDIVAIAGVEDSGAVVPVHRDGLRLKLKALARLAPGIGRIIVSADQVAEAKACARRRFEVLGVRSASEAVKALSGERVVGRLILAGTTPAERRALTTSLLRLVLLGRDQCLDWSPVERAADSALQTWMDPSFNQRYTLEFVRAVAARHQANRGVLNVPPAGWLDSLPRQLRLKALANLVQQASDSGSPPAEAVLDLVDPELPKDPSSAFSPQLELAGAVARLRAASGRTGEALQEQELLARAHFEALNFREVSRPLCEWLRLAGVLGENDAFERGLKFAEEAEVAGVFDLESQAYLDLARARGCMMLNRLDPSDAGDRLNDLARSRAIPDHVQRSAARWRLARLRKLGRAQAEQAVAWAELRAACPETDSSARVFVVLAELDAALEAGDTPAVEDAVQGLSRAEPALVSRLTEASPLGQVGAFLARHYPY